MSKRLLGTLRPSLLKFEGRNVHKCFHLPFQKIDNRIAKDERRLMQSLMYASFGRIV